MCTWVMALGARCWQKLSLDDFLENLTMDWHWYLALKTYVCQKEGSPSPLLYISMQIYQLERHSWLISALWLTLPPGRHPGLPNGRVWGWNGNPAPFSLQLCFLWGCYPHSSALCSATQEEAPTFRIILRNKCILRGQFVASCSSHVFQLLC